MVVAGAIVAGGAAAALLFGSGTVRAASPAATTVPAASAVATAVPSQPTATNPFGRTETVSDASVVAKAIGITEAQLNTALSGGQTVAAIAKAHNVAPQKVIDALVTDGLDELAAQVKAGTLTQAQADAQKAAVTQRATDQVNGTFSGAGGAGCAGGPGGPGGHGGPGGARP
jgi:hypothetical protein